MTDEKSTVKKFAYFPRAFTKDEVLRYYNGWRPSEARVLWWWICYHFKYSLRSFYE